MAIFGFDVYIEDQKISSNGQSVDNLYAGYIQWLIQNKNQTTAPVSELLFQIKAISDFVQREVSGELNRNIIIAPVNHAIKNIFEAKYPPNDPDWIVFMLLSGIVTGITSLMLLGISFAPLQSRAPYALQFLSACVGVCSAIAFGIAALLKWHDIQYDKALNKEINPASLAISNMITNNDDNQINPVLSAVKKTLLTACQYTSDNKFAVMDAHNYFATRSDIATKDPYVHLTLVKNKFQPI